MTQENPSRRALITDLAQAGCLAVAALVTGSFVARAGSPAVAGSFDELSDAATKCLRVGKVCETHCITELGQGNKSMAACLASVRDMLAASGVLLELASANSKHTKAMAKTCTDIFADCAKTCEAHIKHMPICAQCNEACLAAEKAARNFV